MKKIITNLTLVFAFFLVMNADSKSQIVNIPDANFKAALVGDVSINTNGDGEIQVSEAVAYTGLINVSNLNISDLTGIEAFTSLQALNCSMNQISNLNLSQNTTLTALGCNMNLLISLDISNNTSLNNLICDSNMISSLDLSHNPLLGNLDCRNNLLSNLDVSNEHSLYYLKCDKNTISSLDLSQNGSLSELRCSNNSLISLDVSHNPILNTLSCSFNSISSLNLSANPYLGFLNCDNNFLDSLDVSQNTSINEITCFYNQINVLDVSNDSFLVYLDCSNNSLYTLNLANGNDTNFTYFIATNNPILYCIRVDSVNWAVAHWTNDVDNTASFNMICINAQIVQQPANQSVCPGSSVSFSVNAIGTGLTYIWRKGATILNDGGNISGSTTNTLSINPVDTSDVASNYNVVVTSSNSSYDISINATLTVNPLFLISLTPIDATCAGNDGVIYNTVTGGSGSYTYSWSTGATDAVINNLIPDSYFITVTDVGTNCIQTAFATINSNTQIVYIPDSNFKAYLLGSGINTNGDNEIQVCEALAWTGGINVAGLNIADLTGIEAFPAITSLDCYGNLLTSLNVNSNYALTLLRCSNNSIGSLIVAQNIDLVTLICNNDNLSSLNLTQNLALTTLRCYSNSLTTLDVSLNTALFDLICDNNSLTSLNVANGNDSNFVNFSSLNNPDLTCIQVDNVNWATTTWTYPVYIDSIATFSLDCSILTGLSLTNEESTKITIYPNPALSTITIHQSTPSTNQQILITNILGEEIYHQSINNSTQSTIDVSRWSNGVYFYQIIGDKEILQGKFVVEK